ncbi:MAG: alpha-L-rhamnosidase C-terminal domain-containing protein, partial [Cyclobacteriaceae bacterium]
NKTATILLDQTYLTTAYPVLNISGGKNAEMILTYAEAPFDENGRKGNRDVVEGKRIIGYQDKFISDGEANREFTTLWFRTFRYLKMEITTQNEPLTLNRFYSNFTAYPFQETASFNSDEPTLGKIWEVGWRTARLCAGETYFDCPYYEQLQYVGDTRIQALISLYVDGDDRLMKKAIELFDNSRLPFGLTMSRYPTSSPQVIPPYSLFWVAMIHDYYMHKPDLEFVEKYLFGIQSVLQWYEEHLGEDDLLGPTPWWNFVDWTEEWPWVTEKRIGGVPEGASVTEGGSSIISLQYAYALMYAADLMDEFGKDQLAKHYLNIARRVKQGVQVHCWNEEKGFYSDVPGEDIYSQHANIMALLVDMIPQTKEKEFMRRVLDEPELIQTTFYYKYYLVRAMVKAGLADQYIDELEGWRDMLDLGLTTFAEKPDPTRSDCHAWSASPNYDFLATVCGIMPASPGFKMVKIAPALGPLKEVKGEMPHPQGMIKVELKRRGKNGVNGFISLPEGVSGIFVWQGEEIKLRGGKQKITN